VGTSGFWLPLELTRVHDRAAKQHQCIKILYMHTAAV